MKIDRRGFIKFVVGAGVGFHLTPWPYKLIDDSAIWTQNWPWVPQSTRFPELEYSRTVCTLCDQGACGVDVRLVNGERAAKAEGAPNAPTNQSGVCPIGATGPQYHYELSRFQGPLKRVGGRGSGAWARMTWSEAFKTVGSKLAELREAGKAQNVALISGRKFDLTKTLAERFMTAYGSPNVVYMPSLERTRPVAEMAQFGSRNRVGYDLENASYVISFGAQIVEGWGSPVQSIRAYANSRNGGKLVMVDSRASLTASKADEWIAVAPGTEGALALGLAAILVANGLYDKNFVETHTHGFDQFKDLLFKEYAPDKVAAVTGVAPDKIQELAHELAKSKPALAVGGRGKGDMPTPAYELMAVMALNALLGNINRQGGVIVKKPLPLTWPELAPDEKAQQTLGAPRLDGALGEQYPWTDSRLDQLIAAIETGGPNPVDVLIIDRADPAFFGADPGAFYRALAKVPLVVSLSPMADDTSLLADIVLPSSLNYDGGVDVADPIALPYPLLGVGAALYKDPRFDVKPTADIYIGLAKAVGDPVQAALPFKDHKDMVSQVVEGILAAGGMVAEEEGEAPGAVFGGEFSATEFDSAEDLVKALYRGHFWYDPSFDFENLEGAFQTKTGKFEFYSETLKEALQQFFLSKGDAAALSALGVSLSKDAAFMPHYEPTVPAGEGPLLPLLLVPVEQFRLVASALGAAPNLVKSLEDLTLSHNTDLGVDINPETAEHLHLGEGDLAELRTEMGSFHVRVHLFTGARPGVVYAPIGLGHRGFNIYLRGKGSNPMTIAEPMTDPLSGVAMWWGTKANLTKV